MLKAIFYCFEERRKEMPFEAGLIAGQMRVTRAVERLRTIFESIGLEDAQSIGDRFFAPCDRQQ